MADPLTAFQDSAFQTDPEAFQIVGGYTDTVALFVPDPFTGRLRIRWIRS